MSLFHPYNLLIGVGLAPQIVTETIYRLARQRRPMRPEAVHIVTTGTGEAFVEAGLFGETRYHRGSVIREAAPRWEPFCQAVFAGRLPKPQIHAAKRPGDLGPLDDLRTSADAEVAARLCYGLVFGLTRPDQQPLVACIAGGRKTMSADLQTAFSIFARPCDRLVHLLVSPDKYEYDRHFYYPTEATPDAELHLVEVQVPRLYGLLQDSPLGKLAEKGDLRAILKALARNSYTGVPERVRVWLGVGRRGGCVLRFYGADGEIGSVEMSAADTATLLTLAEQIRACNPDPAPRQGGAQGVDVKRLLGEGESYRQRRGITNLCTMEDPPGGPWKKVSQLSQAISNCNKSLEAFPLARDFLTIDRTMGTVTHEKQKKRMVTHYRWKTGAIPVIEVVAPPGTSPAYLRECFPFNHLPLIEP